MVCLGVGGILIVMLEPFWGPMLEACGALDVLLEEWLLLLFRRFFGLETWLEASWAVIGGTGSFAIGADASRGAPWSSA